MDRKESKNIDTSRPPRFVYSNSTPPLSHTPDVKRAAPKSLAAVCLYLVMAVMLGLYVYALIMNILYFGLRQIIGAAVVIFPVGICCLILLLSVFGLWGRFLGWATKHKSMTGRDFRRHQSKAYEEMFAEAEANEESETTITVYASAVVMTVWGQTGVLDMAEVKRVQADCMNRVFNVTFTMRDGCRHPFRYVIPIHRLRNFEKAFDCPVEVTHSGSHDTPRAGGGLIVFAACFTFLPVLAGIALLVLHYTVAPSIPVFLGGFFLIGGTIAFFSVIFRGNRIIMDALLPALFGCAFMAFSAGFFTFFMSAAGTRNPLDIIVAAPMTICLVIFLGVGILFLIHAAGLLFRILRGR